MMRKIFTLFLAGLLAVAVGSFAMADDWPAVDELPRRSGLPDPLEMFSGEKVTTKQEWTEKRRPELKELFQHYMYGYLPEAPKLDFEVPKQAGTGTLFEGLATFHEVVIRPSSPTGKSQLPGINLLVILPTQATKPVPLFLGMNFCGNHALLSEKKVTLSPNWVYDSCGGQNHQAVEPSRGSQFNDWGIDTIIKRGYGFAAFHSADLDPDTDDPTNGIQPHFYKPGQTKPSPQDWGTIAAWAWGCHRAVDYLVTQPEVNSKQIAVIGHSRLGKTALLAAAFDERIALAIPHQAGCGGTAPSRGKVGESVERINRAFPHWFNDTFPLFSNDVEKLPFDQHCLVALMAPRPVLLSNAVEDTWANPDGQFEMLKGAESVYKLLEVEGLASSEKPQLGQLSKGRLGYYVREGNHSMTRGDWQAFLEYADHHFGR